MQPEANTTPTMEYSIWNYIKKNKPTHIKESNIHYQVPKMPTTNAMFLDDLTELLTDKLTQLENIILLGDFNIHIEETTAPDTIIFNDTMEALGLTQHVTQPMHNKGNILDLVFTELDSKIKIYWMQNKHPTIRPLLNHHRYQHQEEQAKHSHKNNQGHHKTITNTPTGIIHTTHIQT